MPAKLTHSDFVKTVRKVHGNTITVLSKYEKCDVSVNFRCNVCDYEWPTKPIYVSRGSKCPRCTGRMRMTHEEYIRKVKLAHGDSVKVIGKYKNNMKNKASLCQVR